jgi:hypothetical protein
MRRRVRPALLGVALAVVLAGLLPPPAYAHGFGERYDLPVPLWLYIGGAGVAVALSFAVIGFFVKGTPRLDDHPHHNLLRWRAGRVTGPSDSHHVGQSGLCDLIRAGVVVWGDRSSGAD